VVFKRTGLFSSLSFRNDIEDYLFPFGGEFRSE